MKYYTVILRLSGAPANAVAVEWTNQATPVGSGQGWEPCLRLDDGSWRFSSFDLAAAAQPHKRGPGAFAGLAFRYRLNAADPWSAASASRKEIVILASEGGEDVDIAPLRVTPFVALAPALAGLGKIGSEVTVAPGLWGGDPAPQLAFQWRRNGTAIPGAVARAYVPAPADDLANLDVAVTARNTAGEAVAVTAALRVTYPAPTVVRALTEEVLDQAPGSEQVALAGAFAGANLTFAAAGATINPQSGVLTIPTDAAISGKEITVTATNSGGSATARLRVTVEALPPAALGAEDVKILRSEWRPGGQGTHFAPVLSFPGLEGQTVQAIEWSTSIEEWFPGGVVPDNQFEVVLPHPSNAGEYAPFMRDPAKRDPAATPKIDYATFDASETARRGWFRIRWRKSAAGPWSPLSGFLSVPLPIAVEPQDPGPGPDNPILTGDGMWRPYPARLQKNNGAQFANFPSHYPRGRYWGEGLQICLCEHVASDGTLWRGGDMHGLRFSLDFGVTWTYPNALGMVGYIIHSITTDPADPNVVIVAAMVGWDSRNTYEGGVFRSTNKGSTFTKVVSSGMNKALAQHPQTKTNSMACQPGGGANSRRFRFFQWSDAAGSPASRWLKSNDSGVNWTAQAMGLGNERCYRLLAHPSVQDTYLAATPGGLRRTTNDGASWSTILTGDIADAWIDPTNGNRIVAVRYSGGGDGGVWHTTNGGATWTQGLARTYAMALAVGALFDSTKRMVLTCREHWVDNYGDRKVYSLEWNTSGGMPTTISGSYNAATWWTSTMNAPDPTDASGHLQFLPGGKSTHLTAHPTNPNRFTSDGFALPWRSDDRSRTWIGSSDGYLGVNPSSLCFPPDNQARVIVGLADELLHINEDYGAYRTRPAGGAVIANTKAQTPTAGHNFIGIVALPNGRIIANLCGPNGDGSIVYMDPNGAWASFVGQAAANGGHAYRRAGDYSRQNPALVYLGPNRSTNGGASWSAMAGEFAAVSLQNGNIVYALSGNTLLRSSDGGASFATWLGYAHDPRATGGVPQVWPARHNADIILTTAANYDLRLIKNAPGGTRVDITLGLVGAGRLIPSNSYILPRSATWCPLDPRRFYVGLVNPGGPVVVMGYFNADYTAASFTDITRNFPRTVMGVGAAAHPVTGELFAWSGCGIYVLAPPTGIPAGQHYAKAALPFFNGTTY